MTTTPLMDLRLDGQAAVVTVGPAGTFATVQAAVTYGAGLSSPT